MFAALSVKTTLFSVLLISLASISIAQEDKPIKFTLSVQKAIHHPQADIEFERTDNNIKWFNDNSLSIDSDLIYGLNIPLNQINLNYKKHIMRGIHSGKALQETCILTSCFWVSSSLISGLESNDKVH